MPISWSAFMANIDWAAVDAELRHHEARWRAMTPRQRAAHKSVIEVRLEAYEKHKKWLDWCAKNKVDPNLVR